MGRRWFRIPFLSRRRRSSRRFFPRIWRFITRPLVWGRRFLWNIIRLFFYPFKVFTKAWQTRQTKHFLQGIPAFLIAGLIVALGLYISLRKTDLPDYYRDVAVLAIKNNQFEPAKIYYERLIELEGVTDVNQFDLFRVLLKTEENARAAAMLNRLAPVDEAGYPLAHYWKARQMLFQWKSDINNGKIRLEDSSDILKTIYAHLVRAEKGLPRSAEVQLTLSHYYIAINQPQLAIPHLARAAREMKDQYFDLSLLYASVGNEELALQTARRADVYLQQYVKENPADDSARLKWAKNRMNLNDFPTAIAILTEGFSLNKKGPFRAALAGAYIAQYNRQSTPGKQSNGRRGNPAVRLALLRKALEYHPHSEEALVQLVRFGEGDDEDTAAAKELLETILATGSVPATVHLALGVKSWEKKELEQAGWHLERAYKQDDRLGVIANNLAWILAFQKEPDYPRALRIMDSVLKKWPESAVFRDTRGQIFMKTEKWELALDDLELALKGLPNRVELHELLGKVYGKLDKPKLADKHQQVADYLRKQQAELNE